VAADEIVVPQATIFSEHPVVVMIEMYAGKARGG